MQSVVTGQAPKPLERKIASGGKRKKQKIVHTITETNPIPQTTIKKGEISVRTYRDTYMSYAKRVAAETGTEETA